MPGTVARAESASNESRKDARNALIASFLGWTLDAFDFFIVVMVVINTGIFHNLPLTKYRED